MGWVQRRRTTRPHLVDLRDGRADPVVFNPEINPDTHVKAGALRMIRHRVRGW